MRVAIVDDEVLARRGIRARLAREANIEIVAEATDARSGLAAIVTHRPHLLFLDIEMPDADGFALLAELPPEVRPLVVFVTAHDDRALDAFGVQALDYLLKPIDDTRFERVVAQARERLVQGAIAIVRHLLVRDRRSIVVLETDGIDWVQSEGDYVRIHAGRRTYLHLASLAALEGQLPQSFMRVHRATIVNLSRVRSLSHITNGDYTILLSTGARLRLSRRYRAAFMERIGLSP